MVTLWPGGMTGGPGNTDTSSVSVSEVPNSNLKQRKLGRLGLLRWCQSSLDF